MIWFSIWQQKHAETVEPKKPTPTVPWSTVPEELSAWINTAPCAQGNTGNVCGKNRHGGGGDGCAPADHSG